MQYKWQTDVALEGDFAVAYGRKWHFDDKAVSRIVLKDGEIPFASARSVVRSELKTGLGNGVSTVYSDFENYPELSFETRVQVNGTTGMIDFTFVPLKTDGLNITEVRWPAPVCADEPGSVRRAQHHARSDSAHRLADRDRQGSAVQRPDVFRKRVHAVVGRGCPRRRVHGGRARALGQRV